MPCPHCQSTSTRERVARTQLGYRTFRCQGCKRTFNERTGTPFNQLTFPTDIILQVVLWRLRYKLSLRDLAEMFLERGFVFTHEAVREWEARFAPLLAEHLRAKRHGQAGSSWYGLCQDSVPTFLVSSVGGTVGTRSRQLGAQQHGLLGDRPRHELAPPFG